jgi:hypothetical protein
MLPWAVVTILLLTLGEAGKRQRITMSTLAAVALLAVVAPWALRNARELGQPIWTTTHGGYTLLLANNPALYKHFRESGPRRDWDASDFHRRWALRTSGDPREANFWSQQLTEDGSVNSAGQSAAETRNAEIEDDRLAQQAAVATIRREPMMFLTSCLIRVGWLWAPYPSEGGLRLKWAIGIWYVCWFVLALAGAVIKIGWAWVSRVWLVPAALVITLTGIHAIYWSNMRMRAPLMPTVYVVAALVLEGRRARR